MICTDIWDADLLQKTQSLNQLAKSVDVVLSDFGENTELKVIIKSNVVIKCLKSGPKLLQFNIRVRYS